MVQEKVGMVNGLPTGGQVGDTLIKTSVEDWEVSWSPVSGLMSDYFTKTEINDLVNPILSSVTDLGNNKADKMANNGLMPDNFDYNLPVNNLITINNDEGSLLKFRPKVPLTGTVSLNLSITSINFTGTIQLQINNRQVQSTGSIFPNTFIIIKQDGSTTFDITQLNLSTGWIGISAEISNNQKNINYYFTLNSYSADNKLVITRNSPQEKLNLRDAYNILDNKISVGVNSIRDKLLTEMDSLTGVVNLPFDSVNDVADVCILLISNAVYQIKIGSTIIGEITLNNGIITSINLIDVTGRILLQKLNDNVVYLYINTGSDISNLTLNQDNNSDFTAYIYKDSKTNQIFFVDDEATAQQLSETNPLNLYIYPGGG
jgi:hypothetical protein